VSVYEGGVNRGSFGAYTPGTVFRVAVEGGVVKYYRNGAVIYTSTVTPIYPLLVDTALYTTGTTISNVGIGSGSAADITWLVSDHLGTPRMSFDKSGSLAATKRHDYLPFGEELFANTGARTPTMGYSADNVRQKFTLKERDNETGLDYFLARYYSSTQGRFTSPDEFSGGPDELYRFTDNASANPTFYADLTNPQSLNKYQYTYNNPLNLTDSDGHCPDCPPQQSPGIIDRAVTSLQQVFSALVAPLQRAVNGEAKERGSSAPMADGENAVQNYMRHVGEGVDARMKILAFADVTGAGAATQAGMNASLGKGSKAEFGFAMAGMLINKGGGNVAFGEARSMLRQFGPGTFRTVAASVRYHFEKHGAEVGARNAGQYLRQATAFARNLRGARVTELEDGAKRYAKSGYYVIKDAAGKILSFGRQ
ncbi:MAG TPA: RHS repeat-associated core domain-containing protein, partial [Pyrinomonadaceae bacterium]|nr:RHS repeat-associated core domain-containing protein [Pyrinomonadaceae bacterium]